MELSVEIMAGDREGFENKKGGLDVVPFPLNQLLRCASVWLSFEWEASPNSFPKGWKKHPPLDCLSLKNKGRGAVFQVQA